MNLSRIALVAGALVVGSQGAAAQDAAGGNQSGAAGSELPAIDVVQETPVQKGTLRPSKR